MKYYSVLFQRLFLVLSVMVLSACGGSGSGGSSGSASSINKPAPKSVSGTAVKGIIANGLVEAYAVSLGVKGDLLASTSTDSLGNYSISIPGEYLGPVLIEISAKENNATLMTCDAAGGCGAFTGVSEKDLNNNSRIDFGEQYPLNSDFTLRALVPYRNLSQVANVDVTLLTHLAVAYAESFPQGFDNLSAELAITQIADLFSLTESPFALNAPDLTNAEEFANAGQSEKLYALISSSLAALAEASELSSAIDSLAETFAINDGQLMVRSTDETLITLERILEAGISNLNAVSETLGDADALTTTNTQLTTLLTAAQAGNEDALTEAEASPTAASSELAKTQQFIADLRRWENVIAITDSHQTLTTKAWDNASGINHYQAPLLQALALSSQQAAIVAVPDLALEAACNGLTNLFVRLACQTTIARYSIEEICDVALNLTLFGVNVCDYLNDLTLPLGNGLWANYALYDRTARIYGELEGVAIDVSFTQPERSGNTIRFDIGGSVGDDATDLTINQGTVLFRFATTLSSQSLQLPQSVELQFRQQSDTLGDDESLSFTGNTTATVSVSKITGSGQVGPLGVAYNASYSGNYQYGDSAFTGTTAISNQQPSAISTRYDINNQDLTLAATLSLQSRDGFTLEWNGKRYQFQFATDTSASIRNQDDVRLTIDYTAEDGARAGSLTLANATYAEVRWLNGSLNFRLADNSEALLY